MPTARPVFTIALSDYFFSVYNTTQRRRLYSHWLEMLRALCDTRRKCVCPVAVVRGRLSIWARRRHRILRDRGRWNAGEDHRGDSAVYLDGGATWVTLRRSRRHRIQFFPLPLAFHNLRIIYFAISVNKWSSRASIVDPPTPAPTYVCLPRNLVDPASMPHTPHFAVFTASRAT